MSDPFMEAMGAFRLNDARCTKLAMRIEKVMDGHPVGERLMVLCFHIYKMLDALDDDPETRARVLSGIMRLIDPPEGAA